MKIIIPSEIERFSANRDEKEEVSLLQSKERCGILIGLRKGENVIVRDIIEIRNTSTSPHLFEMDVEELYKAWMDAEKIGLEVVAIFHTHPLGIAKPSKYDISGLKQTGMIWVIIGLDGIKAYIYEKELKEIDVQIV